MSMPSAYQLFPHPLLPWFANVDGQVFSTDLFDKVTWQGFNWGIYDARIRQRPQQRLQQRLQRDTQLWEAYFG